MPDALLYGGIASIQAAFAIRRCRASCAHSRATVGVIKYSRSRAERVLRPPTPSVALYLNRGQGVPFDFQPSRCPCADSASMRPEVASLHPLSRDSLQSSVIPILMASCGSIACIAPDCLCHRQIPQCQIASTAVFALKPLLGGFAALRGG